ncbi:cytochrome c biogenesis protein ResB [Raineyella sp. LH-20]|uniref:cytochrome c biogenesis protein ResB n=1 Tax=Raineyella sp. LH-20 TaxID=3081204 RepID=UPI002955CE1F|nr:cytochrome c biogenesis protein ResB [Raineyella sp. LH-20]WOP17280.1 cytochrome c biogenesis protein ResB [Raineyella sp. LH-20]
MTDRKDLAGPEVPTGRETPTDGRDPKRGHAPRGRRDRKVRGRHTGAERPAALTLQETGRWIWTQLTSMRTALILLFLLALAAIPGAIVPQKPVNPTKVLDFRSANPGLSKVYDALGLFNVYTSPWFSAIYLLLFISLVGCILPRIRVYVRALRAEPPATPSRLDRLPESATSATARGADEALDAAAAVLRHKRFRVTRRDGSVAAERGYLREFGNLLFHLSMLVLLVGIAWSNLYGYKGTSIVVAGQGFSNNVTQYDDFTGGGLFRDRALLPFSLSLDAFTVRFETGPVQTGAARQFTADVTVTERPGATPRKEVLEVNHPLNINGTDVHLIAHGYAPVVTVTDGNGNVAFNGPVVFLPQDGNFTSTGAVKAPDARPEALGFQGFFLPTATVDARGPHSLFPDALVPELFLNAWAGPPKPENGTPQSVYTLDTTGMQQIKDANGTPVAVRLKEGEYVDLPDGRGRLTFIGWQRWAKLQVSASPGLPLTVGSVAAAIIGLMLSLFVRPRRIWARATVGEDGRTRVEVGGLDRADARTGLDGEVATVLAAMDDPGEDGPQPPADEGSPRTDVVPTTSGRTE